MDSRSIQNMMNNKNKKSGLTFGGTINSYKLTCPCKDVGLLLDSLDYVPDNLYDSTAKAGYAQQILNSRGGICPNCLSASSVTKAR